MKYTSQMIAAGSGALGGAVYSHNAGGQYIRRRAVPVNPQTSYQTGVRNALGTAADRWSLVLTETQREGWRTFAAGITVQNTLGQSIKLSGFQHYCRVNQLALYTQSQVTTAGGFIGTDDPPVSSVIGPSVNILAAGLSDVVGPPVAWNLDVQPDPLPTGGIVGVWLSGPVGVGRNFFKGPYILADVMTSAGFGVIDLEDAGTPIWKGRFGTPVAGQKFWGYVRAQAADGRIGPRANFGPITAA
jgi:hypothetical protein